MFEHFHKKYLSFQPVLIEEWCLTPLNSSLNVCIDRGIFRPLPSAPSLSQSLMKKGKLRPQAMWVEAGLQGELTSHILLCFRAFVRVAVMAALQLLLWEAAIKLLNASAWTVL